jgi:chloramphenicol-sensitive protein RarD
MSTGSDAPSQAAAASAGPSLPAAPQVPDRNGFLAAFFSFVLWGILPAFWKALDSVPSLEVLCHRIVWSFILLCPFVLFSGRLAGLANILHTPRYLFGLAASGLVLTFNWFLYIWAVTSNMILETSLGYYINPLVNILFGLVFFREKISRLGWIAIGIAVVGVSWQVLRLGHLPLVPLGLAFSFGIYGLLRKILQVEAMPGLFVETFVVLPLALGYLLWQGAHGNSVLFRGDLGIDALLVGAGLVTTVPLLLFAYGARRIRMTSLGIIQYVSPTCTFLLGAFVYHEHINADGLITFACIWAALALYTWDSIRHRNW